MMGKGQIYRCNSCGNILELINEGSGIPTCCGVNFEILNDKPKNVGVEKHLPIIKKTDTGVKVKVGEIPHPMEEEHHISWIEIITDNGIQKVFLKPGDAPEAEFNIEDTDKLTARQYCTVHGLWKS